MAETPSSRKWVWWVVSAVAALAILGMGWALTAGRDGGTAGSRGGLSSGNGAGNGQTGSDGGTQTTTPASQSGAKGSGGSAATGGGGGPASPGGGGGGGGPASPGGGATSTPEGPRGTFFLRVAWWNDTEGRAPTSFVIKWGNSGSWAPDATRRSQVGTIGPFLVGSAQSFTVYPDGTGGESITVPLLITSDMRSGSEQDGVHVEVRDYNVRVLGNPVENTEIVQPRP